MTRTSPPLHYLLQIGPLGHAAKRAALLIQAGILARVCGTRHAPRRGPLVVAPAHPSMFDLTLVDLALPRRVEVVLDEQILENPISGWILRIRGAHPLRRLTFGYDERNVAALARAADAARSGAAVLIFPAGVGDDLSGGVVRLAAISQAPVLPVAIYHVAGNRARPRALVVLRRPVPPPVDDPAARRRFLQRMRRRYRLLGLTAPQRDGAAAAFSMALDDARLWRCPSAVMRRSTRLARLDGERMERFLRAARALRRGCETLRCSVDDLRRPPGLRHCLAYPVVAAAGALGFVLCAVPLIALRLGFARAPVAKRSARRHVGIPFGSAYGLALGALGALALGPPGWLLPVAALVGICAAGFMRSLQRRVRCLTRVRRHGHRLRPLLAAFDEACR